MLKIYTDQNFINETYRRKLFPLLFDVCIIKNTDIQSYYSLEEDATKADVFIVPVDYETFSQHKSALVSFKQTVKQCNKPVWVYTAGDFGYTLKNHWVNFRLGGFKSKLNATSLIIPSFINDPYITINKTFEPVLKSEKPQIGFVGHAQSGSKKYIKEWFVHLKINSKQILKQQKRDQQPFYPSGFKRAKYLNRLAASHLVETNYILRQKYRAGVTSKAEKELTTQEFYNNMYTNAYTFCSRGVGNFSVRFYETLAMGRIPVLIDTDSKLPLEHQINWSYHVCIVKESDIDNLPELVAKFHNQFTAETFEALQRDNRRLWQEKLERIAYFKTIHNNIKS
mgnify:CR=1 FL=1